MVDEPNLNCEHCYLLKAKHKLKPLCEQDRGCPIEDLATDTEVNEFCERFNNAKLLYSASELPEAQVDEYRALGLFEDRELWLSMEAIYSEWRRIHTKRHSDRENGKHRRR